MTMLVNQGRRQRATSLAIGTMVLAATVPAGAETEEARRVVVLPVKAADAGDAKPSIYGNYLAAVIRRFGFRTITFSDVTARTRLAQAQRLVGCEGAKCVAIAGELKLDLEGDEIVTAEFAQAAKTSPLLVVMARLDATTGVAIARFEGEAATAAALRKTLQRGARVLFGREVDPAATGALLVQTRPVDVRVELDGTHVGRSPVVREQVAAGDHELVLTSSTARVVRSVFVPPGRVARVSITMDRPPVTIHIFSDPPGAQVTVDGDWLGRAPVILEDVVEDEIEIRLQKSGYRPSRRRVRLSQLDSEARRRPHVVLVDLSERWPVGVGLIVGTTFEALTVREGTALSAEAYLDLFDRIQVGVGFTNPVSVFGSLRAFAVREDLEVGVLARAVGVRVGGDSVDSDLRRWELALMGGLVVGYSRETAWGRFGVLVEGGPSFLVDRVERWTFPVTAAATWRFQ